MKNVIENNKWLSDKFFNYVDGLSEDDFVAMIYAIEKRKNADKIEFIPVGMNEEVEKNKNTIIDTLLITRQDVANSTTFTNDQKIAAIKMINDELKKNWHDLPPPPTEINQVI